MSAGSGAVFNHTNKISTERVDIKKNQENNLVDLTATAAAPAAKPIALTHNDIALALNLHPYSLTCHPVNHLPISRDDSNTSDIYVYALDKLEPDTLLKDCIDYVLATEYDIKPRRVCLIIPDSTGIPAAYCLDFLKPNYIAAQLLKKSIQDKPIKKSEFNVTILSDKNILACSAGLYNEVDFKYIGSTPISPEQLMIFKSALSKACKSKPLNPSFSEPTPLNIFYDTIVAKISSVLFYGNECIEKFFLDTYYDFEQQCKTNRNLKTKLNFIKKSDLIIHKKHSFEFKFEFLKNRNHSGKFAKWLDITFEKNVTNLREMILTFIKNVNTPHHDKLIQSTQKILNLAITLPSSCKYIALDFYLGFFEHSKDLEQITKLVNEVLLKFEPLARTHFLNSIFHRIMNVSKPNHNKSESSHFLEGIATSIRNQILLLSRASNHNILIQKTNVHNLELLLKKDREISELLKLEPSINLIRNRINILSDAFIIDFLIQKESIDWLTSFNGEVYIQLLQWNYDIEVKIQKLKNVPYKTKIVQFLTPYYNMTLPRITAELFFNTTCSIQKSEFTLSLQNFISNSTPIFPKLNYALGLGTGLYALSSYYHLWFLGACLLGQKTYEYLNKPELNKEDSELIYNPFDKKITSFLQQYKFLITSSETTPGDSSKPRLQ